VDQGLFVKRPRLSASTGVVVFIRYAVKDPDVDSSAFLGNVHDMAFGDTTADQNQLVQEENGRVRYQSDHRSGLGHRDLANEGLP
jgi:hypothetical protein